VAVSFLLLAPYLLVESTRDLVTGSEAHTSWVGIGLAASSIVLMPVLAVAKHRLGARLDSAATAGEGTQNMLCAYLAGAVLVGLLANTLLGAWWLDPVAAILIGLVAAKEGQDLWHGEECGC
jgi:divalent metal cation (Fe/Co/Zn/Cd) transporter